MWKKFLALTAILATVAAMTTFSLPASAAGNYIQSATATPDSFNPTTGAYSRLNIQVVKAGNLTVKVLDGIDNPVHTFVTSAPVTPGPLFYIFYGTVGNAVGGTALSDGTYKAKFTMVDPIDGSVDIEYANVSIDAVAPVVTNFTANPTSFSQNGGSTTISFTLDDEAYITATIEQNGTVVRTFTTSNADYDGDDVITGGTHSFVWDGKKDDGTAVADGIYTVKLATESLSGLTADYSITVTAEASPPCFNCGYITDLELNPTDTWDPSTDDAIEITYDLEQDATSLKVYAIRGLERIEIADEGSADKGEYDSDWDGVDEDDEYIVSGDWDIQVEAMIGGKKYAAKDSVNVTYEQPTIDEMYVTKDSFDPDQDETTVAFFRTGSDGVVTVTVYEGTKKIVELVEDEDVEKDKWYSVEWDGEDDDGDQVDFDTTYTIKATIENAEAEDVNSSKSVSVDVEEDEESSDNKTNIVNDEVLPTIIDESQDDQLTFSFCIEDDAEEVTIGLYEGNSSSGSADIVLADEEEFDAGCHEIDYTWTGKDDDNKTLDDDSVYAFKVEVKKDGGSGVSSEKGKFAVGEDGNFEVCTGDDCENPPPYEGDCAKYYTDTNNLDSRDSELCTAIAWVTENGIFNGYPDRSFRPYTVINRAETVKVILNAFDATILPADGSRQGFTDVDPYAWYMPYVRTAVFYGMLDGYGDGTARLANTVNRVEMLKFALEAARAFVGLDVYGYADAYDDVDPAAWYAKYVGAAYTYGLYDTRTYGGGNYLDPDKGVERGEVALMLYRMNKEGVLVK